MPAAGAKILGLFTPFHTDSYEFSRDCEPCEPYRINACSVLTCTQSRPAVAHRGHPVATDPLPAMLEAPLKRPPKQQLVQSSEHRLISTPGKRAAHTHSFCEPKLKDASRSAGHASGGRSELRVSNSLRCPSMASDKIHAIEVAACHTDRSSMQRQAHVVHCWRKLTCSRPSRPRPQSYYC